MWIRDVDLPEAVVNAHQRGQLVLFVGAGASRSSPSDLPDFRQLTKEIAEESQVPAGDRLSQPDQLLGDLEGQHNVDVHKRVAARIGIPASSPNRLHKAIVALSEAGGPVRIVTTNYDLHLASRLDNDRPPITQFRAPALPMGDDFIGLVYLHGNLQQEPRELVVTDADFGRAYLRDAWAARFLERMFATFTVLFIGYSHDDVVMTYLARALGRTSYRYVLTDDPDAPHWRRLNIVPIAYPNADGSHQALPDALEKWASQSSMKLLDHRQQIARLVAAPPSPEPDEASYMETVVTDEAKVRFFTEHARSPEWLLWVAGQPEFHALFDPHATATECAWPLAMWFAEHYVNNEEQSGIALRVLRDAGGHMSPMLRQAIGHRLHAEQKARPDWLGPWVVLLLRAPPQENRDLLDYALTASHWPQDRIAALLLFDYLTEPQPYLDTSFSVDETPRINVDLRGSDHWLREAWTKLFVPNLSDVAADVISTVDRHIRRAHQMLTIAGTTRAGWDPLAFGRSAIEAHGQDRYPGPTGLLVDAARDCLQALLDADNDAGRGYLADWGATDVPLLRRLAIHGWAHRNDVDATAKLSWLRDRGWLYDHQLRHEVFGLIEVALRDAEVDVADAIVEDAVVGPSDIDEEYKDYEIFNALAWMKRHAPELRSAQDALDAIKSRNPEFAEREHPDLLAWSETGTHASQPPMPAEDLHDKIVDDTPAAIAELLTFESATSPFQGPTWYDTLALITSVVQKWPADGFTLHDQIRNEHPELLGAVIRGWAKGTLDDLQAASVIALLRSVDLTAVGADVAHLLADSGQGDNITTDWLTIPAARQLATALWDATPDAESEIEASRALNTAINDTAGRIAEFWVLAIAADWRAAGDAWDGISTDIREQLDNMLAVGGHRTAMVEVIFVSRLHFFFGADRAWCEAKLLPLLGWADADRARRTWDAFLGWGRWNDQMLTAGLLGQYLETSAHVAELGDDLTRQLCMHLAGVAVEGDINPVDNGWARQFTTTVEPHVRALWMSQIEMLLGRLPPEAVKHQWERWMRHYWKNRIDSVPVQLTAAEASAMAAWVVHLADFVDDAVTLATSHPAGLVEHSHLLHDLAENHIRDAPEAFAKLIAHLLEGTSQPFYGCYKLKEIVPWFRSHLPAEAVEPSLKPIIEHATRLGCGDAPNW